MSGPAFPFRIAPVHRAAAPIEGAALAEFAVRLAGQVGQLLGAVCHGVIDEPLATAFADPALLARSDGLTLALDLPLALVELVAVRRLGGLLSMTELAGTRKTPSVRRAETCILAGAKAAANLAWRAPAGAEWRESADMPVGRACTVRLDLDMLGFEIGCRVAHSAAAGEASAAVPAGWWRSLERRVGATALPVRAVLHERTTTLADVARLRPGDVLPIDVPRAVRLRIGRQEIGSGAIAMGGPGGSLTVTLSDRPGGGATGKQP